MKNKRILSIVLAVTMSFALLSTTGCKKDEPDLPEEPLLSEHPSFPDIEVPQKLKIMTWYDIDETTPTAELFREKYGIPEAEKGTNIFDVMTVNYSDRYSKLSASLSAGDSPDMFPFEEHNFPWGAFASQYQPIDDIIDLSGAEWDATRDIIEQFKFKGKNYCAVTEVSNSTALLFYRKTIVQEAGLEDPYDLWMQNKWDWNTFEEMCIKFSDPEKGKYPIMGYYIDESAILSTGKGLISLEDGFLKSNLYDSCIERAMALLEKLAVNNYRYPYHELSDFEIPYLQFQNGNVLFWNDGPWQNQEGIKTIREEDNWYEDELCIVPFPRDPESDSYYHRGSQSALMLISGSHNIDGFKAWTQCAVLTAQDMKSKDEVRTKKKVDYGWTDFRLDTLERILEETDLVWDFKSGMRTDFGDSFDSPAEQLSKFVIINGEPYAQVRETHSQTIEARIEEINSDKYSNCNVCSNPEEYCVCEKTE